MGAQPDETRPDERQQLLSDYDPVFHENNPPVEPFPPPQIFKKNKLLSSLKKSLNTLVSLLQKAFLSFRQIDITTVFEFFFSKLKSIPEIITSAFQKISKILSGVKTTAFNQLSDVMQDRAEISRMKSEKKPPVLISEAEKKFGVKTDGLKASVLTFGYIEYSFSLAVGIFDWVRQIQDTKAALQKVSNQPKGQKNYFDVVVQFAKMPFLALQNLLSLGGLVALTDAAFEKILKDNKAVKWLLTALAYLGGHIIGFAQNIETLYRNRKQKNAREIEAWNQALRDLIKQVFVLVVSSLVTIIAIVAFDKMSLAKDIRPFFLVAMTAVDGVFKYFPQFFEGIRDFGWLVWRFGGQVKEKGLNAAFLQFKDEFSERFAVKGKMETVLDAIKDFGKNFRKYHEKQANVEWLERKKPTAKKIALFSGYALLTVIGFVGSFSEFISSELLAINGIAMPVVLAISSALFLFSTVLLLKHYAEYKKVLESKNLEPEELESKKTAYIDKMIAQAVKMLLSGLIIGLSIWAIAVTAPAVALYAIAGVAAVLFYGYVVFNRKFSEKEELYKDFELKQTKPEASYVEAHEKAPCLYLITSKSGTSLKYEIKCDLLLKKEVKTISLDLNKLGKHAQPIIDAIRMGNSLTELTEKQKEALFEELTAQGCHRWGRTGKALWPAVIRTGFQEGVAFIRSIPEKVADLSQKVVEAFYKLPIFIKRETEEKKDLSFQAVPNQHSGILNSIENLEGKVKENPSPTIPALTKSVQNPVDNHIGISKDRNCFHNNRPATPVEENIHNHTDRRLVSL